MASRLVKQVWCDHHDAVKQEEIEATTHTVVIDGRHVDIDLCAECLAPVNEMATFLETYGRLHARNGRRMKTSPSVASPAREECPQCGNTLKNRAMLQAHMRREHGTTLKAYEAAHLPPVEVSPEVAQQLLCPECGFSAKTPQGLATHQTRKQHRATEASTT